MQTPDTGWKPIPFALKFVFVFSIIWAIGTVFAIPTRYDMGLPLMGVFVFGLTAVGIMVLVDLLGPLALAFGIWKRKAWAVPLAFAYMGFFIVNSLVALFTVREQLGLMPILIPALIESVLLLITFLHRNYFK